MTEAQIGKMFNCVHPIESDNIWAPVLDDCWGPGAKIKCSAETAPVSEDNTPEIVTSPRPDSGTNGADKTKEKDSAPDPKNSHKHNSSETTDSVKQVKSGELPSTSLELFDLAIRTNSNDLAKEIVNRLYNLKPEGYEDAIRNLAKGDSRAAAPATETAKSTAGDTKEDEKDDRNQKDGPKPVAQNGNGKSPDATTGEASANKSQERVKNSIEVLQKSLGLLTDGAQKAKFGLGACNRQLLQDLEKVWNTEVDIQQNADNKDKEILKDLRLRLGLLKQDVEKVEKDVLLEQATVEKPLTLKVQIACLRIASGDDRSVAQGEKELLEIVRQNPSVQVDPDFTDAAIKAYIQMTAMRRELKLPPWKCSLSPEQLQRDFPSVGSIPSNPLEIMSQANTVLWKDGFDKALPLFSNALDMARKAQPGLELRRLQLFIDGLNLTQKLSEAAANNGDVEILKEKRKNLFDDELEAYDKTQVLKSIEVNIALARIASGRADLLKDGKATIVQWLESDPSLLSNKEFRDSLRGAFVAYRTAAATNDAAAADGKPPANTQPETKFKAKFDVATLYGAPQEDAEIRKYSTDLATDIGLAALLLGSAFLLLRHQRNSYLANRAIQAEFGPKPVEGAPKKVVFRSVDGSNIKERSCDVKGRMPGTDLVVIRDPSARNDWKGRDGIPVSEGFEPKSGKYGDFKRLHVGGTDYFVSKDNKVFVHQKDRLISTREITISNPAEFQKQTATTNSLLDVHTASSVRLMIHAHPPGAPIYANVSKFLNLPEPKIEFAVMDNAVAGYRFGKGIVVMKPDTKYYTSKEALDDRARSVIHEMTHLEQDTLITRKLADDLKVGASFSDKDIEALQEAYKKAFPGPELDADFAKRILALRNGVPLTQGEVARVEKLSKVRTRDLIRKLTVANCDRDIDILNEMDKLLKPTSEKSAPEAKVNTARFYKQFADSPEKFRDLFGTEPSPEVAKIIEQFKTLMDGEVPRPFNVENAREALKTCLEKQYNTLRSGNDAAKAASRGQRAKLSHYLADIGHPVGESIKVRSFLKELNGRDALNFVIGDSPPKDFVEIFHKAMADNTDSWSEENAREIVRRHLANRIRELDKLRSNNYFAIGVEQECWEVTRRNDLAAVELSILRIDGNWLESYELAMKLSGNQTGREISTKIFEVISKRGFSDLSAEQKSKGLNDAVTKLLKEQLPPGMEIPGSVKDVRVKVGDFNQAEVYKHDDGKPVFEIRIPEKMFSSKDGCIDVAAIVYADVYAVAELDVKAGGFKAVSQVGLGPLVRRINAESVRALCAHALANPDIPAFGERGKVPLMVDNLVLLREFHSACKEKCQDELLRLSDKDFKELVEKEIKAQLIAGVPSENAEFLRMLVGSEESLGMLREEFGKLEESATSKSGELEDRSRTGTSASEDRTKNGAGVTPQVLHLHKGSSKTGVVQASRADKKTTDTTAKDGITEKSADKEQSKFEKGRQLGGKLAGLVIAYGFARSLFDDR